MLEIIFYAMGILLGISLLAKLISTITVRRMVAEAAEIQKSNHKLMKLIKAKFEHASLVSNRVQNVGAFVDKYLYEYKIFGIRLHIWQGIPKKGLLILLILGVFTICESVRMEGLSEVTMGYIQWIGIFILLLSLVQFVSSEKAQMQAGRNYMVEYLENVCIHRYEKMHNMKQEQMAEEVPEERMQVESLSEETQISLNETQVGTAKEGAKEETKLKIVEKMSEEEERSQQEMRIRAILEEFLA